MKKGLITFLAFALILVNPLSVSANYLFVDGLNDDEPQANVVYDENQTINLVNDGEPEADLVVNARLGRRDNTIANPDLPVGDPRWINVTLPTVVIFHSNWDVNVEQLISPACVIANNSYMGLSIFVADFEHLTNEASATYIENLHIVVADNSVRLMDNDGISIDDENLLVTMIGNGGTQHDYEPSTVTFGFAGNLESVPVGVLAQPTFNLILTFESVARSGNGVEEEEIDEVAFAYEFMAMQSLHSYNNFNSQMANIWDNLTANLQQVNGDSEADISVTGVFGSQNNQTPPPPSQPDQTPPPQPDETPPPPPDQTPDPDGQEPEGVPPGQAPPAESEEDSRNLPQTGTQRLEVTAIGAGIIMIGMVMTVTGKRVKVNKISNERHGI